MADRAYPNIASISAAGTCAQPNDKQRIIALEARLTRLEDLVERMGEHQVSLGTSLIRAHQKTMEIEGDLAAVGIGNKDGKGMEKPKLLGIGKPKLEVN